MIGPIYYFPSNMNPNNKLYDWSSILYLLYRGPAYHCTIKYDWSNSQIVFPKKKTLNLLIWLIFDMVDIIFNQVVYFSTNITYYF